MAKENEKLVFRWHFLIIYLLIAAIISYALVNYKTDRDAPPTISTTDTHDEVKVTEEADSEFDVDDDSETEYVEPGTIQEYVSEEDETVESTITSTTASTTVKPTASKPTTNKPTATQPTTSKPITTITTTRPIPSEPDIPEPTSSEPIPSGAPDVVAY